MEIIQSIIIGGIQGISEFLPISSSGHLVLIPYLFKWNYNGLSFDVALHFGTVIALIAYFWKDWKSIIANAIINLKFKIYKFTNNKYKNAKINENCKLSRIPQAEAGMPASIKSNAAKNDQYPSNLLWQIIIATIPAGIVGYLANDYIDRTFHSSSSLGMLIIALNLALWGILLWYVDKNAKNNRKIGEMKWTNSLFIGFAQALALMPGVSRSGITITASRSLGLSREQSAKYSFLIATPAMIGAFLTKIKDIGANDLNMVFILGVISSTIFSFLAIRFLLSYLKKSDFNIFVWYRIALAIVIIGIYLYR